MGSRQNKHSKSTENYQNVARVSADRKHFDFLWSYLDTKSCITWMAVVVIQGPQSALLNKSDYRWENDSYLIFIALAWHEAIKKHAVNRRFASENRSNASVNGRINREQEN